jgi:hypothetical protein
MARVVISEPFQTGFRTFVTPDEMVGPLIVQGPPMSIPSIVRQQTTFSLLAGLATAWKRSKLWFEARRQQLAQQLTADRLMQLRQRDPHFYEDIRVGSEPLPPSHSAMWLLPHAVIADFFLKERR